MPRHAHTMNPDRPSRRDVLKALGATAAGAAASALFPSRILRGQAADIVVAGRPVELAVSSLSAATVRLTVRPIADGAVAPVPVTGALVADEPASTVRRTRDAAGLARVRAGDLVVRFTDGPPAILVETAGGATVQRLTFDRAAPGMSFLLPTGPLLGLGEGGPQFDRKGSTDAMRN